MTANQVLKQLKSLDSTSYAQTIKKHGVKEPVLGVKIADLKKLQKQIKTDHTLALDLYDTGIYDAQYLAGLIVDDQQLTKRDLQHWLSAGNSPVLCGSMLAWVTAESNFGLDMALKWIDAKNENAAQTGWMTLSSLVAIKEDAALDIPQLKKLLKLVERTIHDERNLVRSAMNGFVIAVGSYVSELTEVAIKTAEKIGPVNVDVGDTSCKVPSAVEYITKVQQRGTVGKKKKSAKC